MVQTSTTNIEQLGKTGEQMARIFLKSKGYSVFEIDWFAVKNNKIIQVEVKHKERFNPPPFYGHGMEIWKIKRRLDFEKLGFTAMFMIFDITDGHIYCQYLKKLNEGNYFDTKKGIRIYPIENFVDYGKF
jgi:hypothetical protein